MSKKQQPAYQPPPHANALVHKAIMEELKNSSAAEIAQTAVDAGIYTSDGKLTAHYRKK